LGANKTKRAIEVLTTELDDVIYVNMKERIQGRYYGEQAARFDELVRKGIIVNEPQTIS
jgi:hypothetical protein